jgi:hypothetical protein
MRRPRLASWRAAVEDGADLVEGNGEHVVEDAGEPPYRRQRLERAADGVGEQRLVLRVDAICVVDDRSPAGVRRVAPRGAFCVSRAC